MSEALVVSVKEMLTPFTGRQQLEEKMAEYEQKRGKKILQVVIMDSEQLLEINRRSAGCEYFVDKVRALTGELLDAWHQNDKDRLGKAVLHLRDVVSDGQEPGDEQPETH